MAKNLKAKFMVVTRGSEGYCYMISSQKSFTSCPAFANNIVDKIGAGDLLNVIVSAFVKN